MTPVLLGIAQVDFSWRISSTHTWQPTRATSGVVGVDVIVARGRMDWAVRDKGGETRGEDDQSPV